MFACSFQNRELQLTCTWLEDVYKYLRFTSLFTSANNVDMTQRRGGGSGGSGAFITPLDLSVYCVYELVILTQRLPNS